MYSINLCTKRALEKTNKETITASWSYLRILELIHWGTCRDVFMDRHEAVSIPSSKLACCRSPILRIWASRHEVVSIPSSTLTHCRSPISQIEARRHKAVSIPSSRLARCRSPFLASLHLLWKERPCLRLTTTSVTLGNEQWKPGYSLAFVQKEGKAGEPVIKIQTTPWLLVSKEDQAGDSNWIKNPKQLLLGWWSQWKTQLRTRIKRITPCLIVSEKTNRETEKVKKCLLSLADGLKERSSLGTEIWIEFLLCIRRVWKWNQSAQPMEKFGHWISLIIEATSCRKKNRLPCEMNWISPMKLPATISRSSVK